MTVGFSVAFVIARGFTDILVEVAVLAAIALGLVLVVVIFLAFALADGFLVVTFVVVFGAVTTAAIGVVFWGELDETMVTMVTGFAVIELL